MTLPRLVPRSTTDPTAGTDLRHEVRRFVADQLAAGAFTPSIDGWLCGWDEKFTAALAAQGWLGMTVPVEYGGHGRSFLDRFVVTEELLAAGHTGAEYDAWLIRIQDGDQFGSGFVEVNPNSKIPALVDRTGSVPVRVFESGAIMLHLAETFRAFVGAPEKRPDELRGLQPLIVTGSSTTWSSTLYPASSAAI